MDGGAVGKGIRKRNAEFHDIHAGFFEGGDESGGGLEVGVSGGDVGDEAGFFGGAEGLEFFVDAVHGLDGFSRPRVIQMPSRAMSAGVTPLKRAA